MFKRKKDEQAPVLPGPEEDPPRRAGPKNRPTPSRREAEAARRRPLVPEDRKAASQESRARMRAERTRQREAMIRGEQWALPPRDRGPQRQFVRDFIDARWSVAEFLLPIMIIGLPVSLLPGGAVVVGYAIVYGALVGAIVDTTVLWFRLKRAIRARFDADPQPGTLWYATSRAIQIRPGRMPRPRHKRGERVHG